MKFQRYKELTRLSIMFNYFKTLQVYLYWYFYIVFWSLNETIHFQLKDFFLSRLLCSCICWDWIDMTLIIWRQVDFPNIKLLSFECFTLLALHSFFVLMTSRYILRSSPNTSCGILIMAKKKFLFHNQFFLETTRDPKNKHATKYITTRR